MRIFTRIVERLAVDQANCQRIIVDIGEELQVFAFSGIPSDAEVEAEVTEWITLNPEPYVPAE
jgi:hypothetical protein